MRSKSTNSLLVGLLALAFGNGACQSVVSTNLDCACCLGTEDVPVVPDVGPDDVGLGEVADGGPVGPAPKVGQACEADGECELGLCLSNEFLQGMGIENEAIDVPNGMCSTMACTDDDFCGPNGVCFDTTPFTGMPITICLVGCEEMADCRWAEGYSCYSAPLEPDNPEAGLVQACLPDSLVVAIECDDGHCEGLEQTYGHCDELADCYWQDGYSCYRPDAEEEGLCVPDQTVLAAECDDGSCPMPAPADGEEG
jgi:hypothetical protein